MSQFDELIDAAQAYAAERVSAVKKEPQFYSEGDVAEAVAAQARIEAVARQLKRLEVDSPEAVEVARFVVKDDRLPVDQPEVEVVFQCFGDGTPALLLVDADTGEPYGRATIQQDAPPPAVVVGGVSRQCVWMKEWSENEGITPLLVKAGVLDAAWANDHPPSFERAHAQLLTEKAQAAWAAVPKPPVKLARKPAMTGLGM